MSISMPPSLPPEQAMPIIADLEAALIRAAE